MVGENSPARDGGIYDRVTIALHWMTALLVAVMWVIGRTTNFMPRGPWRLNIWSTHVLLGFALVGVLAVRILWRAGPGRSLPAADPGLLHKVAKATHWLLYLLLIAVVGLGIANALVRGFPLFDIWQMPQVGDPGLVQTVNGWHGLAANAVIALAGMHAVAALVHYYVWRDDVLGRMLPASAKVNGAG